MTLYQQEMLRKLGRLDCAGRYDEEKGLLVISSGGTGLCCQDKKGYLSWESEKIRTEEEKAVLSQIGEQAKLIRAYVGQYENSPSMGIPEVEGYRRMAECGDTVMAGMYSEQHGFMFTTWTQNGDRSRVTNGDYSPNYEYVKDWIGWQKHMENLISRLDELIAQPEQEIEFIKTQTMKENGITM